MLKKCLFTLLLMLLLCVPIMAQLSNIEYGDKSDLKGVTKIFVHTDAGLEVRENVIKHIKEKIPQIQITSRAEDAEIILLLDANVQTFFTGYHSTTNTQENGQLNGQATAYGNRATYNGTYNGTTTTQSTSTPQYRTIINASGLIFKVTQDNRVRTIMDFHDSRKSILERRPSTNFAKAFVKAYQEANK